tara:strand:- start:2690 stop:3100 length:411 start_codon:yes stop_codon:yes gene_type:complete
MNRDITINYSKSDLWWKTTLEDLWVTILEGGSNYWVDKIDYDKPEWADATHLKNGAHLAENFEVTIYHNGEYGDFDGEKREFTSEVAKVKTFDVIYDGIKLLSDDVKMIIMTNGDWDANDADHIFQLGVFGEVRYG